jgi:hypothetical protein
VLKVFGNDKKKHAINPDKVAFTGSFMGITDPDGLWTGSQIAVGSITDSLKLKVQDASLVYLKTSLRKTCSNLISIQILQNKSPK